MHRLKRPPLLGYLLGGLILGSFAPDIIIRKEDLTTIGQIGIAFLLFTLGVELSFDKLRKVGKVAIVGAILQMVFLGVLSMLFLPKLLGLSAQTSLFLGITFSLSSTAVVTKMLSDRGEIDTAHGELLIAWLLVQDLAVVPILIFFPLFLTSQSFGMEFFLSSFAALGKAVGIICATYILGRKILTPFAKRMFGDLSRELLLILTILVAIASVFAFTLVGLPGSIGAFLAGLILSGRASSHAIFSEIRPFRDLFSAMFFVLLGTIVSLPFIILHLGNIIALGLFEMIAVFLTTVVILAFFGLHTKILFLTAIGLFSIGEFAFVVAGAFFSQGFISQEMYSLILSVSVFLLLLAPWQIQTAPALYSKIKKMVRKTPALYNQIFGRLDFEEPYDEASFADHVIICGHGRVGREISAILNFAQIPFIVIDFNRHVVSMLRAKGIPTFYGDPSDYDILDLAKAEHARAILIALPDRHSQELIIRNALRLNPKILIICRSHFDEDRIPLLSIGANVVVQPEFEAGVSMGRYTLVAFGKHTMKSEEFIKQLKKGLEI